MSANSPAARPPVDDANRRRLEQLLADHARSGAEREALVYGERRLSYGELHRSVRRIASGLHRLGVRPGARVLLYLPNGIEFVQLAYAAFTLGAGVVPVNTRLAAREVEHIARDSAPAVVAFRADARALIRQAIGPVPQALVVGGTAADEVAFEDLLDEPERPLPPIPEGEDDCVILYTSGTTGKPKGALNTHANMVNQNVALVGSALGLGPDERNLVTTPLAHRAGIGRIFGSLGLGGSLTIMDKFDPEHALDLIERERISIVGLPPTVIRMMLPQIRKAPERCATLKHVLVATESFPAVLKREVTALLPQTRFYSVFGMSEALISILMHHEQFSHPASVGRPLPGVEVRIVGEDGHDAAMNEIGEFWVRHGAPGSGAVLKEYYNRPQETASAITDGWFHTGDVGRRDAEGYLYIVDRMKDMVLSGGYNIYSKEVEETLRLHPEVADAAVVGVADQIFGEAVAAFVERQPGARLTATELIEHCREQLAGYKKPKHVFFVDALPRNSLGKVLKTDLRALAADMLNAAPT